MTRKKRVLEKYGHNCWYCGIDLTGMVFEIDHFIPKSKGGEDIIKNLRPSCKSCNAQKRNRDLETFRLIKGIRIKGLPHFMTTTVVRWLSDNYDIDLEIPDYEFYFEGLDDEVV